MISYAFTSADSSHRIGSILIRMGLVALFSLMIGNQVRAGTIGKPIGYASLQGGTPRKSGGGTSGGGDELPGAVKTRSQFEKAVAGNDARVIEIMGTIELDKKKATRVGSNKTIVGKKGTNPTIRYGGLHLRGSQNVIIKNITFEDARGDNIGIEGATHIWIDHCTFSDDPQKDPDAKSHDGLIDIKHGSNFITISYNEFHNHNKTCLVGHSDKYKKQDTGKLKITFHHNYFNGTKQRHPRVRFGEVHLFNNYYSGVTLYAIGIGDRASIYSQANYFQNVRQPVYRLDDSDNVGYIKDEGSFFQDSGKMETNPSGVKWNPADRYPYIADDAKDVKEIVLKHAGAGKPSRKPRKTKSGT